MVGVGGHALSLEGDGGVIVLLILLINKCQYSDSLSSSRTQGQQVP